MRTLGRSGIVAAMVMLLAGCGGSAGPTATGSGSEAPASSAAATAPAGGTPRTDVAIPDEPCTLLTADDLKAEFSVAFPPVEAARSGETRTDCIWDPTLLDSGAAAGTVVMTVMAVNEGQWDIGRTGAGAVLVPGTGDDAYFSPLVQGALEVRVGTVHLRFSVDSTGSQADADASLVALAKLAVSRL